MSLGAYVGYSTTGAVTTGATAFGANWYFNPGATLRFKNTTYGNTATSGILALVIAGLQWSSDFSIQIFTQFMPDSIQQMFAGARRGTLSAVLGGAWLALGVFIGNMNSVNLTQTLQLSPLKAFALGAGSILVGDSANQLVWNLASGDNPTPDTLETF